MSKLKDLTGQRFGTLAVLHRVEGAKPVKWHCRCDCGKEVDVLSSNLIQGCTTSCGCKRADTRRGKPTGKHKDITGQRFGRLVALKFIRHDQWLWQCDCGNTTVARPSLVKAGEISSCGCLQRDQRRADIASRVGQINGTSISLLKSIMAGKLRSTNTTGHTGISVRYNVSSVVYVARIVYKGKDIYLGQYATLDAAIAARKEAEETYFGAAIKDAEGKKDEQEVGNPGEV